MAKLVARLLTIAALWVRVMTSPKKYTMGDISTVVANTLLRDKNMYNEKYSRTNIGVMGEVG